jgi:predicted nuclease of predicted toxin-antitoxin system
MKFLIDNQLPVALQVFLSGRGYDAEHVLELGMAEASDLEVSQYAARDERTIITKDEDFSVLVTMGRCSASVIWVRFGNCRTNALLECFSRSLDLIVEKLRSGERVIQLLR